MKDKQEGRKDKDKNETIVSEIAYRFYLFTLIGLYNTVFNN